MIVSVECKSNMDDCRPPVLVGAHALMSVRWEVRGRGSEGARMSGWQPLIGTQ